MIKIAKSIEPLKRGESEITDISKVYQVNDEHGVEFLGRGFAWLDIGTHDSHSKVGPFEQTMENR